MLCRAEEQLGVVREGDLLALFIPPVSDDREFIEQFENVRLVEFRIGPPENESSCVRIVEAPKQHAAPATA